MGSRLASDLASLATRRQALGLGAWGLGTLGLGGGLLTACKAEAVTQAPTSACRATPAEIRGPFPADGTNGGRATISVFGSEGLVRRDITPSFAGMTGSADGIPLDLELRVVRADGCTPRPGTAIYLWQCDALGAYSLYNLEHVNYLRGVQVADAAGVVRFASILPGCYGGRAPHFHFEAFDTLDDATHGANSMLVSQIAFPTDECARAYADPRYGQSLTNLRRWPTERDWMFAGDSAEAIAWQTVELSGDPAKGYAGTANVGIA